VVTLKAMHVIFSTQDLYLQSSVDIAVISYELFIRHMDGDNSRIQ
jgi:hypothetical protein